MDRYWKSNTAASAPAVPVSNAAGFPVDGNPSAGVTGTVPGAWWYHVITEEIRNAILKLGGTPDWTRVDQLGAAITGTLTVAIDSAIQALAQSGGAAQVGFLQDGTGAVPYDLQSKSREHVTPQDFGIKNDFDVTAMDGPDYTAQVLDMVNYAASKGYSILIPDGVKIKTDTIALYRGSRNPDYPAKPGRMRFYGGAVGLATGALETQGAALIHKNGAARPLIETIGTFSVQDVTNMGGQIIFERVNLWGGDQTTDVIYTESANGQQRLQDMFVRISNPAGNGVTEKTTWEGKLSNVTIYGRAAGDGSWTGIGLNICSNDSTGQINMKVYENVNVYKCGQGIRIGRRDVSSGTFGPLVFIGGQVAWSDQRGMWLDGGAYNVTTIGHQIEQSRLNALYIASAGANDLPRNCKFIDSYFTNNGKIADGSPDQYDVHVVDGVQIEVDHALHNNSNSGYIFDATNAWDLLIRRPIFRTTSAYGKAQGKGIDYYNAYNSAARIRVEDAAFNQGFASNIPDAFNVIASSRPDVKRISISNGSATPSIGLGGDTGDDSAVQINLNNQSATTITNFLNARTFQRILLTFSNLQTTIRNGAQIALAGATDFVPSSSSDTVELLYTGSRWVQIGGARAAPNGSGWNDPSALKLGAYTFWVDSAGRVRIKGGTPASDTDGTIVGTQT